MIVNHAPIEVDLICDNGATIVTGSYTLEQNKLGRVRIEATILDTVNGNIGISEHVIAFHRYSGNAVIDSTDVIIALKTPGTLNGSSVSVSASGNTITSRFTGVASRNIRVIASFKLTTIKDG